jgi:acyl-homoserine-lactone acylase
LNTSLHTMKLILLFTLIPLISFSQTLSWKDIDRSKKEAQNVTITRDTWGVPHIYGKSDADAVFGLMYAQCEENFSKVEENNLEMMGRLSEIHGEPQLYDDLQMRLIYDSAKAINDYNHAPAWLQNLCIAAADGVNYYLYKHPAVKPAVLTYFEPWFALMRTNGSISATQNGGITVADMKNLYPDNNGTAYTDKHSRLYDEDPTGSNGFAVAPSKTLSGNAILYINPHVTFYYRTEVQMVSDEGLNVYGAVTWGTFFVFQGFNEYCGWMHTSGETDIADLFKETVIKKSDSLFTKYDDQLIPVTKKQVKIKYKKDGKPTEEKFTTYYTIHGPVMGSRNGVWLSLRENNRSLSALMQSWLRTKTKGFDDFKKIMNLRSNTSDNTVFADNKGNIAYWHGNYVPRRNNNFDYSQPVDGSTSLSDWQGIYALDSIVHVYNPATGFIQNCNSTPFTVAGTSSPVKQNYPVYMAPDGENFRAVNAASLLSQQKDFTINKMIRDVGYNHHLSAFDVLITVLLKDYDNLQAQDSLKNYLHDAVTILKAWDKSSSLTSVATTIAIEFGYRFMQKNPPVTNRFNATDFIAMTKKTIEITTPLERLQLLSQTLEDLTKRFGKWQIQWGQANRYQRITGESYSDNQPSLASGLAPSAFGSLPAFAARRFKNTNKRYGVAGNSFIACVEFGKRVKAKSVITGGQSFDPMSRHYADQAQMYLDGNFKDVLFYKEDVMKHVEKSYHPGM